MHIFIIFTKLFKMFLSNLNLIFATKVTNIEILFLKYFPHFKIIFLVQFSLSMQIRLICFQIYSKTLRSYIHNSSKDGSINKHTSHNIKIHTKYFFKKNLVYTYRSCVISKLLRSSPSILRANCSDTKP
jgi:hypothetical protein